MSHQHGQTKPVREALSTGGHHVGSDTAYDNFAICHGLRGVARWRQNPGLPLCRADELFCGDTQVIVNPQGPSTQIPITVTTLDHLDPSTIHSSDYIFA